jgi:hypothetical protein
MTALADPPADTDQPLACQTVDAELFFPLVATVAQLRAAARTARTHCGPCPLRRQCRALGQQHNTGLWGGLLRVDDGRGSTTSIDLLTPLTSLKEAKRA